MRIQTTELREIRLPLRFPYETSVGRTTERKIILTRVLDTDGGVGWGECTSDEDPFYSEEWTDGSWLMLQDYLAPLLLSSVVDYPGEVDGLFKHIRRHHMAKAALETACWDLAAHRAGLPLWQFIGGNQHTVRAGVAIGLQESVEKLIEVVGSEQAAGYQRVKIKIKPGRDIQLVAAVRGAFPDLPLMVDANSAYSLADLDLFRSLDRFSLMMIEQPLAHDDLSRHAVLQRQITTPICLDESVCSPGDAEDALSLGSCRVINVKLGRVGGYSNAIAIERLCRAAAIPLWCGGMLESGVGRAHNVALSTLEGFSLPGDLSASSRYWDQDIIQPPVTVSSEGLITPSSRPGLGHDVDLDLVERLTVRRTAIHRQ